MNSSDIQLEHTGQQLQRIVKEAGKLLLSFWRKPIKRMKKEHSIVTEADLASEKLLIERLEILLPQADFWTEESGAFGTNGSGYHWVIDPLDGTRNFASHIPYFAVSVALTYNNEPVLACIYNPILDELFYARKGAGAFCNGEKIEISPVKSLKEACVAISISYRSRERIDELSYAQKIASMVAAVRHMGAVALDLANLSIGRFDGAFWGHLAWWDIAAGILLVEEAGGNVADLRGEALQAAHTGCVAGGQLVFDYLRKIVKK